MIFVDTGAWFASFVADDPDFAAADRWLKANNEPLVTTDFVLDELFTLLKCRGEYATAVEIGEALLAGQIARIEWVTPEDLCQAWAVFRDFHDKQWSFTDCSSLIVMRRLEIRSAFAFDTHFQQFGTVATVP